ncbi:MAG TPA: hypothetical protein VEH48_02385 [Candidatus Nitrosopolaris sp.]|nr:hypothetical protein [Candidatus Nitrosopolaris sp.]
MPFSAALKESGRGALKIIKDTLRVVRQHPEITFYPYAAVFFISITYPLVSATVFASWYRRIFSDTSGLVPGHARAIIGLVVFSAFYTALVTAYFTCATSVSVIAKLDSLEVPRFYGLLQVARHFFRVTRFALISVFFFPIGIYAQRKKLPSGWIGVLGSSLTLHMAQVAPAVLATNKPLGATVRNSVDSLGRFWREGLVLKITMYLAAFVVVVLPKLIQHGFFHGYTASKIGWAVSIEIAASGLVGFKVLNSIFTAVMYHEARSETKV